MCFVIFFQLLRISTCLDLIALEMCKKSNQIWNENLFGRNHLINQNYFEKHRWCHQTATVQTALESRVRHSQSNTCRLMAMLALRGYYILLRSLNSWRTMQTTCLSFRCCHTRSVPSRHGAVFFFGPIAARRGLLSSQDQCKHPLSCCRQLSTSSKNSCSHIGKIESTHYQLIYTCKVR